MFLWTSTSPEGFFQTRRTSFTFQFAAKWIPSSSKQQIFISSPLLLSFGPFYTKFVSWTGNKTCQILPNQGGNSGQILCFPSFFPSNSSPSCPSEDSRVGKSPVSHFKGCSAANLLSLSPSASLHPHRPPLYFPTAAERALPVFLPLHFCAPALNLKKGAGLRVHTFFLVVFCKTRRILGKWRSRFQGVLMEISIQCYSLNVSSARLSVRRLRESSDCRGSRNRTDNFLLSGPEAAVVASITTQDPVWISQNSLDSLRRSVHVSSVWKLLKTSYQQRDVKTETCGV